MSSLGKNIFVCLFLAVCMLNGYNVCAQPDRIKPAKTIFADDFNSGNKNWMAEFEQPATSGFTVSEGKLDLSTTAGATIWYKNKLKGNIMITYHSTVVTAGGKNDRLSDMNAFWMASNPNDENSIKQNGKFSSYDSLHLYYAGVGGHDNTTTRFRKYDGSNGKDIVKEYTDQAHLLEGNHPYAIRIIVDNGLIQYYVDDILYWEFNDTSPYREGYFGFRTTKSHQVYQDFQVVQLK